MSTTSSERSGRDSARPVPSAGESSGATTDTNSTVVGSGKPTDVFGTMEPPETTQPWQIERQYAVALSLIHILAVIAFVPMWFSYLFSWTGVAVAVIGHLTFGMLGITIGYHRLLTHQGFTCPKWFEHTLAIMGICTLQDSPARWVAIHRVHHKHSDEQHDPHSPLVSLIWGHMGWLFYVNRDHVSVNQYEKYVRDLLKDPFYLKLERNAFWLLIYVIHGIVISLLGMVCGLAFGSAGNPAGTFAAALQMGLSFMVWGVFVRTVFVLHGTWAVNSLSHVWGYRNYETSDNSRNNWFVALISHGEGWHNNHHHDQRAASHGHKWHEFDMSWWIIRSWEAVGLVSNVVRPRSWTKGESEK